MMGIVSHRTGWFGLALLAVTLLAASPAQASHFRGGSASYTLDDSGLLTVEVFSLWRSDFVDQPFMNLYTGPGASGSSVGSMTLVSSTNPYATGTELGGAAFVVRRDVFTYNLASQSAGTYYARWESCCRVGGILNNGANFSLEVKVIHQGVGAGLGNDGPTILPATIDIVGRGASYTQNLNSVDNDLTPVNHQFRGGTLGGGDAFPDYGPVTDIPGIALDAPTGTVSISAANTAAMAAGRWVYKVRVEDGSGATAERDVLVVAQDLLGNNPPALASIGPKTISINNPLTFGVSGTDPDSGNGLTVRARLLPPGATFPDGTATAPGAAASTFSWTPVSGDEGVHKVYFEVFDDATTPLISSEIVDITVTGTNNPPVLDPIGNQTVSNGGTISFAISGSDPDGGQSVSYSAFFLPPGASFDSNTGVFTWTPSPGQYDSVFTGITFRVTDDGVPNLFDDEAINITVGAGNQAPGIAAIPAQTVNVGQTLTFNVVATDGNGAQTLSLTPGTGGLPAGATFPNASGTSPVSSTFTWTPTLADLGSRIVRFRVEDSGTPILSFELPVTINVVQAVCGNGVVESGEACDDGDLDDTDCCTQACAFQGTSASCRQAADFDSYLIAYGGPFVDLSVGWRFTPSVSLEVSAVGIFDFDLPGLLEAHEVAIWQDDQTPIATATVPAGAGTPLVDSFRYVPISPVTLVAGQTYVIGALFPQTGIDHILSNGVVSFAPSFAYHEARELFLAGGLHFPTVVSTAPYQLGPNFLFEELCGNGAVDAGESCDDGNRDAGDCCGATCLLESAGSACASDGELCTLDVCDGAGACTHPAGNSGVTCRSDAGDCDVAEVCDGASPTCPADGAEPGGTPCTDDGEICTTDTCDGAGLCVHAAGNLGATCRAAGGTCDPAETCDGAGATCPPNVFAGGGTPCGDPGASDCDAPDSCDGAGACAPNHLAAGTACDDGEVCTAPDECDGAGACATSAVVCAACESCVTGVGCTPASVLPCDAQQGERSTMFVKNKAVNQSDRILFRWTSLGALTKGDFGNPLGTTGTGYELCVYDDKPLPGAPKSLIYSLYAAPGGICDGKPCWKEIATGFVYKNKLLLPDGVQSILLKAGAAGKAKAIVRAKGAALGLAPHDAATFFGQSDELTVVLLAKGGRCFRSTFTRPWDVNTTERYKDRD